MKNDRVNYCANCKKPLKGDESFCAECGAKVEKHVDLIKDEEIRWKGGKLDYIRVTAGSAVPFIIAYWLFVSGISFETQYAILSTLHLSYDGLITVLVILWIVFVIILERGVYRDHKEMEKRKKKTRRNLYSRKE